jgi:hypothetical protein
LVEVSLELIYIESVLVVDSSVVLNEPSDDAAAILLTELGEVVPDIPDSLDDIGLSSCAWG